MNANKDGKLALFEGRPICKVFHEGEMLKCPKKSDS